ncbi:MAG: cytochrome P450-like enzyme [Actinomycetia bacterium]|nr:cytochrome P450-like enzyme [Actinomycetes bacterium]
MAYGEPGFLLTRYEDVKTVLGDTRFGRSHGEGRDQPRTTPEIYPLGMIGMDGPEHTRLRRFLAKSFTARRAEEQRAATESLANSLIDNLVASGPPADLVEHVADQLPMGVLCQLLGVPPADREVFHASANVLMYKEDEGREERMEKFKNLTAHITSLINKRRAESSHDLISELVLARYEDQGLSEEELVDVCLTVLAGGYESTSNQIGNFVYLLLTHPDQMALLRERPELLNGAVEELLRFAPLAVYADFPRYASCPATLSGGPVTAGQPLLTSISAANRDPRVYEDPESLEVTRQAGNHLSFGHGAHYCTGAALAGMVLQVAIGTLIDRIPDLRLAVGADDIRWKTGPLFRGPVALPVTW